MAFQPIISHDERLLMLFVRGDIRALHQPAYSLISNPLDERFQNCNELMLDMVQAALDAGTRHLTLEVRVSNGTAQKLYDRFGFEPVGRRKNYYKDEDALVMWATDIDTDDYQDRIASIRRGLEDVSA